MRRMRSSDAEYAGKRKKSRREVFLAKMEQVVPWDRRLAVMKPRSPKASNGRSPCALKTMLRIHWIQNGFGDSDPAMGGAVRARGCDPSNLEKPARAA